MFSRKYKSLIFLTLLCSGGANAEEQPGWEASGSWIVTGQRLSGAQTVDDSNRSQLNTRLDFELQRQFPQHGTLVFTHIRAGSGSGLQIDSPLFTGSVNTTAFSGTDKRLHDPKAVLAQAWVQVELPQVKKGLSVVAGKIDPTVFFDQSTLAHDESLNFINNLFVHNPLLDTGGNYGIDENGFSPGGLIQYETQHKDQVNWAWTLGAFGAGNGTMLDRSPSNPSLITQLRTFGEFLPELEGSAALYYWTNPKAENFLDGSLEKQSGFGFSGEQALSERFSVFTRLSHGVRGVRNFDRAITGGFQYKGFCWGRPADHIALAIGHLKPDRDSVANGAPSSPEKNIEFMYAYQVNSQWTLAADLQRIQSPGGNSALAPVRIAGMRSTVKF